MKRRHITLIMALVCAIACAFGLTACKDEQDTLTFVSLSVENVETVNEDVGAKTIEYNVAMSYGDGGVNNYGDIVGLEDIELWAYYSQSGGKYVSLNTNDNPDGYEIEGTLPVDSAVGTYTVKYLYEDWTVKVNFVVKKRKVAWPDFESYYHYWTGDVVKPELLNGSEYITYNHNYGQTEIGQYSLEIDLKDEVNCEWDATDGDGAVITGTRTIDWAILKATYIVDNDLFLSGGTENENYSKCYEYVYDGTAKEFPINEEAVEDFRDKITIEIWDGTNQVVTEMKEVGIYFLILKVKDPVHTQIKNKKESPDGWEYIGVGQLRITEAAA